MSAADDLLGAELTADTPVSGGVSHSDDGHDRDGKELSPALVIEVFGALEKAVRARRLYQANNPVYHGFLKTLRDAFTAVFEHVPSLSVGVEEPGFRWGGQIFQTGEGRDNLAFLFFKDGIRQVTFLPGFETEIERFLAIVYRARMADQHSDEDMVTLLWQEEFEAFQYSYVDALAQDLTVPDKPGTDSVESLTEPLPIDIPSLAQAVQSEPPLEQQPPSMRAGQPSVASTISRDDFSETLYFLDPAELEQLQREVELEWERDIKQDVLNALFDRLEDPMPEWQDEILRILRQLLPAFLSRGDLRSASYVLVELNTVLRSSELTEHARAEAERLFNELSDPAVLSQLLRSLEEGSISPNAQELGVFLSHLNPTALPLLLRTIEITTVPELQVRLQQAVEGLARDHQATLVSLLRSDDSSVAAGAARVAGKLALGDAVASLQALLERTDPAIRRVAVDALLAIRTGAALEAVQRALDDTDREVRMAAVRGLGALRYQPARPRIEAALQGKVIREADLTEKIAFFEAFGAVATADSVDMLDRILNGKKLFARQTPELRACAAMALGKINSPAARASLERAASDGQPIVRNAVVTALRREGGAA